MMSLDMGLGASSGPPSINPLLEVYLCLPEFYFRLPTKPCKPSALLETKRKHCAHSTQYSLTRDGLWVTAGPKCLQSWKGGLCRDVRHSFYLNIHQIYYSIHSITFILQKTSHYSIARCKLTSIDSSIYLFIHHQAYKINT